MGWFFGRKTNWDLDAITPPWGERPGICAHLREHRSAAGVALRDGGAELPDEALVRGDQGFAWAAGARDGVLGHHVAAADQSQCATEVLAALERALTAPKPKNVHALYAKIKTESALAAIDPLLEQIPRAGLPIDRLREFARWLVERAADREAVKFGIALLGLFPGSQHHELLKLLARHEEFTLHASVALARSEPATAERNLFELAKHVDGWGKIHIVERLSDTRDRTIQRWLVRDGCRNSVMNEYLAYTCAVSGRLREELEAAAVDGELLRGTGEILGALIAGQGGPAQGIDEYADAPVVIARYLDHLEPVLETLEQLLVVVAIDRFFNEDKAWSGRMERGWSAELRDRLRARTAAILAQPRWPQLARAELGTEDQVQFWRASETAKILGIDLWDTYFERARSGKDHWHQLMQTDDAERIGRVVALAEATLPLARIACGPAREMGLGPAFRDHSALDFVVQELRRFPGLGWPLVAAALQSPVIRNRNLALRALNAWGRERWPSDAVRAVRKAFEREPDPAVRERLGDLLAGKAIE